MPPRRSARGKGSRGRGRGNGPTGNTGRGRSGGRQSEREVGGQRSQEIEVIPRGRGLRTQELAAPINRQIRRRLTNHRDWRCGRPSLRITQVGNHVVVGSYPVIDRRIRDHPLAVLSIVLPEDILLNIFERTTVQRIDDITVQRRHDRHRIVRRERNCDCDRFPYGRPGGYCGRPVIGYRTGRNLRIHFTARSTAPEREAARIMQALDMAEASEGDGYAISGGSFYGDSSLSDDAHSNPGR
jgi:hypothetical protein